METKDNLGRTGTTGSTGTDKGGSFATQADQDSLVGTSIPTDIGQANQDVVDTNSEEAYWRQNFATRPYFTEGTPFIEYKPAYRYGADSYTRHKGRSFDEAEPELRDEWDRVKGTSSLSWEHARHAARDAWQRVSDFMERLTPGDSDRDGK